jgi:hypothetical protein
MRAKFSLPIRVIGKENWAALSFIKDAHEFVAEKCDVVEQKKSFAGQHRVRLIKLRKSVHWKMPDDFEFEVDISGVAPARRQPPQR